MVIDTSALLAVLLGEPTRPALIAATKGAVLVGAPSLPWEVGNALVAGVRGRQLSSGAAQKAWGSYAQVPVRLADIDTARALELALALRLYAYDAYVLEAARAARLSLLTLDRALVRAAREIGVSLVEWES